MPVFGQLDFLYDPEDTNWTPILEILENLENIKKNILINYIKNSIKLTYFSSWK